MRVKGLARVSLDCSILGEGEGHSPMKMTEVLVVNFRKHRYKVPESHLCGHGFEFLYTPKKYQF